MCTFELEIPEVGICCKAYYLSKRQDERVWCHFPDCSNKNCPLMHPELLEGAELQND